MAPSTRAQAQQQIYDLTVFGATGFVGKLVLQYLLDHPQKAEFSWAIAGRSSSKLAALKKDLKIPEDVGIFEGDTSTPTDGRLEQMVQSSRVVVNLVGPYSDYGSFHLAELCAKHGTSYTDLSGESAYNAKLVESLQTIAQKTGSVLAPSVGYDSLPPDLAVSLGIREVLSKGQNVHHIEAVAGHHVMGSASGGTVASFRSMASSPTGKWQMQPIEPLAIASPLYPSSSKEPESKMHSRWSYWLPQFKSYGMLSPFAVHNTRTVYLSAALFSLESGKKKIDYTPTFQFLDVMTQPGLPWIFSYLLARIFSLSWWFIDFLMQQSSYVRKLSERMIPVGSGPTEKQQNAGFLDLRTVVVGYDQKDKPVASSLVTFVAKHQDPGYKMTSRVISEVSLLLALDHKKESADGNKIKGGLATGATIDVATDGQVVQRLEKFAKVEIGVKEWKSGERLSRL